jgi:hypothetical protein
MMRVPAIARTLHSPPQAVKLIDNAAVSYTHSGPATRGADSAGRLEKTERYPRLNGAGFANLAALTAPFACTSLSSTSIRMYVWVTVL